MSITISDVQSYLNKYFRDASTNSVSADERIQAINEATVWLIEQTTTDHALKTYDIQYVPGLHYYKVTNAIADLLEPADLRRPENLQTEPASRKSSREMAEDIANESSEFSFGVERKNGQTYLVINLTDSDTLYPVSSFDTTTADGGTWTADTSTSDATNVTNDTYEFTQGTGSVKFDIDVSQSGNNRATIYGTINAMDLTELVDLGVFTLDVYIPESLYTSSVSLFWGTDASNYWSDTQTLDSLGNPISDGWNRFKFNWNDAVKTLSPDESNIVYIRIDVNYTASQGDDTSYRLDNLNISRPEKLSFHYLSDSVGHSNTGTVLYRYTTTTDVPFYSGSYEHYLYAVAHKAAAILFRSVGLMADATSEDNEAVKSLVSKIKLFPSSIVKEDRSFKPKQLNFKRRKY